jgi:dolichol kinase
MHGNPAEERMLQTVHRTQLRNQVAAWSQLSNSTGVLRPGPSAVVPADDRGWSRAVPRICAQELCRKLWHIAPGFLILGIPLVRPFEPFASYLPTVIVTVTAALVFFSWRHAAAMTRPGECDWGISVLAFAATGLVPLIAYPADCEVALTALVILSLGDGAAALGGQALGGARLPWNGRKTFAGTLAFVICAAPAAAWVYWANSDANTPFLFVAGGALLATILAALAESAPSSINDNIRVGTASVLSAVMMHLWLTP